METKPPQAELTPRQLQWIRFIRWGAFGAFLFLSFILVLAFTADVPTFEELENPKYDLASVIYDAHGKAYGRYYIEDRVAIDYNELSPLVRDALIATEDDRFYNHSGIDFQALFRVGFKTLLLRQENSGGGSTISQQLAKLLFQRPDMSEMGALARFWALFRTKVKEWVVAVKLERRYTKEEILTMYLNKFEFINGAHGIEAAAQIYFGKSQKNLAPEEIALLIGMLKNPSLYNPMRFPEKAKYRRNVVLSLMEGENLLEEDTAEVLMARDIDMSRFSRKTQSQGPAPYFRAELTKWLRQLFDQESMKKEDGTTYNVYTDGLRIFTTIDLTYQQYAEESVAAHMNKNQKRYWQVWKNMDPWTYDADDSQKTIRADMLSSQVKSSDRYLSLRNRYLSETESDIRDEIGAIPLSDQVIEVLAAVADGKISLATAGTQKKIQTRYTDEYTSLLGSDRWNHLRLQYAKMEEAFKKEFSTPIPMKIYNIQSNKDTIITMSPMDSVRYHRQHLQAGFLALQPSTGFVKAWVGGINHPYFKYDHVTMRRSVGSTIKPFVYVQAMSVAGISPCQEFDDVQYTINPGETGFDLLEEWAPGNATESFSGEKYNLFRALLYSVNSITVKLLKEIGSVKPVRDLLHNVGIDRDLSLPNGQPAVPEVPSICLGAVDLTLLEMTGAYGAFGNNGTYVQPVFVSEIQDKNGKVIYRAVPSRKAAINPLYNAVMVEMLRRNVSGSFSSKLKSTIGGKTGTTNDFADGWFMSVSPELVTGTWAGGDDKWIRFRSLDYGQGASMARPIAEIFYQKLEKDTSSGFQTDARFPLPPAGYADFINCEAFRNSQSRSSTLPVSKDKQSRQDFDEEF
ncbi:MAG: transglycosylase domain-containing protein [Saprospiraceae bacterium]|jgi:penicillin-binding protein 1A|nr:transglycosylase domain-containing protein [Saprospiraceae bacterium]